jgi:threonine/homoserine/homoserine lactone efflux protein
VFDVDRVLWFMAATLALNLSPGPDVLYVLANSARHGARGGILASLGISLGIVFHTCLAAFGVAALLLTHRWAFDALRVAGALYLIWLGVGALRSVAQSKSTGESSAAPGQILRKGFITNVLNPKVALFFLAFLPQFVDPARGHAGMQALGFGALFVASGTVVNVAYACVGGMLSAALRRDDRWRRRLNRMSGGVLILLGARLLVAPRSP